MGAQMKKATIRAKVQERIVIITIDYPKIKVTWEEASDTLLGRISQQSITWQREIAPEWTMAIFRECEQAGLYWARERVA